MNVSKLAKVFVAVTGLMIVASGAHAADSVTVTVNANINGVCKFFTAAPVVTIANSGANIDPSSATTATGNADITYRCSNGTSPVFVVPATASINNGAAVMVASISSTNGGAGTGMGSAQGKTLNVVGSIAQAGFENAPAGAYSGTMTVTVTP